jgi:hypothetical protein
LEIADSAFARLDDATQLASMALVARQLDPFANPSVVEAVWGELADGTTSYFLSWPWVENWLATLPRHVHLRLLTIFDRETPIAACFVGRRTLRRAGFVLSRALHLNATGHPEIDDIVIEHNRWLVRSPHRWPLGQLLEHLPSRGWDELFLDAMDKHVLEDARLSWPLKLRVQRTSPCPVVQLEKVRKAKDGYLSLLGSETRSQIRRSTRLYGPLTLEVAKDLPEARAILRELLSLHEASWNRRGKPGAFTQPYLRAFHERLVEKRFVHGEIQLLRVRAQERTVGCLYNFLWNGTVSFYQSGLASETDNRLKPGLVCHAEAVVHNANNGHETYDFLGGTARYKRSLSTDATELVWASVQRPRPQFFLEDTFRSLRARWREIRRSNGHGEQADGTNAPLRSSDS